MARRALRATEGGRKVTRIDATLNVVLVQPITLTPSELAMMAEELAASLTLEVGEVPMAVAKEYGWKLTEHAIDDSVFITAKLNWVCCMDPDCTNTRGRGFILLYGKGGADPTERFGQLIRGTRVMQDRAEDYRRGAEEAGTKGWS